MTCQERGGAKPEKGLEGEPTGLWNPRDTLLSLGFGSPGLDILKGSSRLRTQSLGRRKGYCVWVPRCLAGGPRGNPCYPGLLR